MEGGCLDEELERVTQSREWSGVEAAWKRQTQRCAGVESTGLGAFLEKKGRLQASAWAEAALTEQVEYG